MTDSVKKNIILGQLSEDELLEKINYDRIPRHICIIMDGNRRWAKSRNLPTFLGHREGVEAFRKAMIACCELGIEVLTVYAFSMENWRRTREEVNFLMGLFVEYCKSEEQLLLDMEINFNVIGNIDEIDKNVQKAFNKIVEKTKDGKRMAVNICVNYSSRYEITRAALILAEKINKGEIKKDEVNEDYFGTLLYTGSQPDPDLMVRTSGEVRISNFLLWQNAYSEFYFTDIYWPDFDKKELLKAILDYQSRDRRFGGGVVKVEEPKQNTDLS
ncbi:MAG: isoprenyl transferase [Vulcanimicrobiota bacterium]